MAARTAVEDVCGPEDKFRFVRVGFIRGTEYVDVYRTTRDPYRHRIPILQALVEYGDFLWSKIEDIEARDD